jgi:PilZ domain
LGRRVCFDKQAVTTFLNLTTPGAIMQNSTERRSPSATRIPFEAFVEVGSQEGATFEAKAMDLSGGGIHLRTAYLPEVGQPLSCRFESGNQTVVCDGEVMWCSPQEHGGEFGLRFENLDADSEQALQKLLSSKSTGGSKVRLHIEGLGSPMRARLKNGANGSIEACSDLGFLKVGKGIELEDAASGERRPARIDHVEVAIDDDSKVPQLVVGLRYSDVPESLDAHSASDEEESETARTEIEEGEGLKDRALAVMGKVSPMLSRLSVSAKSGIGSIIAKARKSGGNKVARTEGRMDEAEGGRPRRVTAPPPASHLHGGGMGSKRAPLRSQSDGQSLAPSEASVSPLQMVATKKRPIAIGLAAFLAVGLGYGALHKSSDAPKEAATVEAPAATMQVQAAAPVQAAAKGAATGLVGGANLPSASMAAPADPMLAQAGAMEEPSGSGATANGKPQSFGQGNVSGGQILRIKMDGAIGRIQGAAQPTGFTVVIPGRKAQTSGTALQKQDKRFSQVKLSNDGQGLELNVAFKDGVPPYLVRANKDVLEVVLGKGGGESEPEGDSRASKGHGKKSGKGAHKKSH